MFSVFEWLCLTLNVNPPFLIAWTTTWESQGKHSNAGLTLSSYPFCFFLTDGMSRSTGLINCSVCEGRSLAPGVLRSHWPLLNVASLSNLVLFLSFMVPAVEAMSLLGTWFKYPNFSREGPLETLVPSASLLDLLPALLSSLPAHR